MAAGTNANNHGGARPGAGRKRKAEAHAAPVAKAERRLADRLPRTIDNLEALADGGAERVEESWEPAGTITRKGPLLDREGNPTFDARGNPLVVEQPAFPDRPPDELVLVARKVVRLGPDYRANEYLANRVMGRPAERFQHEGADGGPIQIRVVYDDLDPHPVAPPAARGAADDPA